MSAILTTSGHAAVATAVKGAVIHLAWGTGSAGWDTTPVAPDASLTGLVAEIGRREASQKLYCTPDAAGELYTPSGRFTVSSTPTRYLYCRFDFDYTDASSSLIREAAVFVGTTVGGGVPGTTHYYLPGDIASPGSLMIIERFDKIVRSVSVRQSFEYVLTL